jgi:hypothetical protein
MTDPNFHRKEHMHVQLSKIPKPDWLVVEWINVASLRGGSVLLIGIILL